MRRGQVALEFLVTYGWALLVVMVMIGAISYFGVTNPSKLLPDKCVIAPDFSCIDYILLGDQAEAHYILQQGTGQTIYYIDSSCQYEGNVGDVSAAIGGVQLTGGDAWKPRAKAEFTCSLPGIGMQSFKGSKIRVSYNVTYTLSPDGLMHEVKGDVYSEVQ